MTHPLTPPPKLVQQWVAGIWHEGTPVRVSLSDEHIAARAAQWGADQELEALLTWLRVKGFDNLAADLLVARRPKPPSLKEEGFTALELLKQRTTDPNIIEPLRRALESIND